MHNTVYGLVFNIDFMQSNLHATALNGTTQAAVNYHVNMNIIQLEWGEHLPIAAIGTNFLDQLF